jgi:hypothetical protein
MPPLSFLYLYLLQAQAEATESVETVGGGTGKGHDKKWEKVASVTFGQIDPGLQL